MVRGYELFYTSAGGVCCCDIVCIVMGHRAPIGWRHRFSFLLFNIFTYIYISRAGAIRPNHPKVHRALYGFGRVFLLVRYSYFLSVVRSPCGSVNIRRFDQVDSSGRRITYLRILSIHRRRSTITVTRYHMWYVIIYIMPFVLSNSHISSIIIHCYFICYELVRM